MIWIYFYIFILGLIFGSFFNVVGIRVPLKESIIKPPSHCPKCERRLQPYELIPIISYIVQHGKCRHCQAKISPLYPFFELVTGLLFVFAFYSIGFQLELIVSWTLISLLVIITISDLYYQLIPNRVLLFFLFIFVILRLLIQTDPWYDAYLGGITGFIVLLIIAIISKGGMGGGDIKLFGVIGMALGVSGTFVTLFLATLIGAVIGLVLMVFGKVKKGVPIAFGPFIAIAAVISYFFEDELIQWYFQTFIF